MNARGVSPDSDEVTVTPGVPPKPILSVAGGVGNAVLSASVSSDNGSDITKWQYQQKAGTAEYGSWVDIAATGTSMTHTVTGLTNGTEYTFRVRAVNARGNSPDSDGITTTPGLPPTKPELSAVPDDGSA